MHLLLCVHCHLVPNFTLFILQMLHLIHANVLLQHLLILLLFCLEHTLLLITKLPELLFRHMRKYELLFMCLFPLIFLAHVSKWLQTYNIFPTLPDIEDQLVNDNFIH